jgi:hypothetical protein
MSERTYRWFIEVGNQLTNEVVADWVETHGITQADAHPEMECSDGAIRSLWECPHLLITQLRRSGIGQLDYTVWVAEGAGKPRQWKLSVKKKFTTEKARPAA